MFGEKIGECFHSIFAGNLGDVFGRFNAEVWDASPGEIAQKVAIVAGNFDHVTFAAQGEFVAIAVCAFGGMLYPHIRVRRKINVFTEELNRRHKVSDLQQPTFGASGKAQREAWLGLAEGVGAEQIVRQRLLAKVEN